jgi:hypothetical protein
MFQIDVTSSILVWALGALLLIYSIFWVIRSLRNTYYSPTIRNILIILRCAAIVLFLFLLFDLRITHIANKQVEPEIAFLWDRSKSMDANSDAKFMVTDIVGSRAYKNLVNKTRIDHIVDMLNPKIISELELKRSKNDEEISDNSKLLRFAEKQVRYKEIVLISDGQSYLGEDLEEIKLKEKLIVHTVGVGDDPGSYLPLLRSVRFPDHILQGDTFEVKWSLQNPHDGVLQSELILKKEGQEVFRQEVEIPPMRMISFEQNFAPSQEGPVNWTWSVRQGDKDNVIAREDVLVYPSAVRIVCYADPLDQDISMVENVLSGSDKIKVYKIDEWRKEFPDEIPDILIQTLHSEGDQKMFKEAAAILFYKNKNASYITSGDLRVKSMQPFLYFEADPSLNAYYWQQLPPVQVVENTKPGIVLLETKSGIPLISENSKTQDIIITASGLWRWNLAGYEKDWNGLYEFLIHGMIQEQLRRNENGYIGLDEELYTGISYQAVQFRVDQFNKDLINRSDSRLRVSLLDTSYMVLQQKDIVENMSSFILKNPGEYFIKAELFSKGLLLESDTSKVIIRDNDLEGRQLGLNDRALKKLAADHAGTYLHVNDLDSLSFTISTQKHWEEISKVFITRKSYWLIAFMFLLLCADWIIRKRSGGM